MDPNATVSSDNTVHLVWTFQDMTAAGQYRTNIYYAARPQGGP
ncbi:MAG: hypothetical protein M5U34_14410 [Chloroflexi bacterium]|nr:hypothetical protein [Chloroflexota bacterium]